MFISTRLGAAGVVLVFFGRSMRHGLQRESFAISRSGREAQRFRFRSNSTQAGQRGRQALDAEPRCPVNSDSRMFLLTGVTCTSDRSRSVFGARLSRRDDVTLHSSRLWACGPKTVQPCRSARQKCGTPWQDLVSAERIEREGCEVFGIFATDEPDVFANQ